MGWDARARAGEENQCPCLSPSRDVRARALFVLVWVVCACHGVVVHCRAPSCCFVPVFLRALLWSCVLLIACGSCSCRSYICVFVPVRVRVRAPVREFAFSRYAHETHGDTCHVRLSTLV